ncbi:MAG: AMP-binding protein [Chlamydiia bacterium]|nr:AMP-binding protein [Chlamydiia bacterium]
MRKAIQLLIYPILWFLISLRYRINVTKEGGIDPKKMPKPGGILFLPNHPAEIDPPILMRILWFPFKPRPVALESLFHLPFTRFFLRLVGAVPVPSFEDSSNSYKRKQIELTYQNMYAHLRQKENLIFYPAGGLKVGPEEVIGGASGVHKILQDCPDINVVFIRTTGLWGSRFSKAITGKSPDIVKTFLDGFWSLLKNGLFFSPRRNVHVHLELAPKEFPFGATRRTLNRYLENWYNKNGPEPLNLVSRSIWQEDIPAIEKKKIEEEILTVEHVPDQISERVIEEVAQIADISPESITAEQHLARDMGFDSIDVAGLVIFLKEYYGVSNLHSSDLTTVGSVMLFAAHLKKVEGSEEEEDAVSWQDQKGRPPPSQALGTTLIHSFLFQCDRMGKNPACVDGVFGELNYEKVKWGVIALARVIKKYAGTHIGVMLPASIGVNMVVLATILAGKVPVMINWTLGSRNLESVVSQSNIHVTISSWNFLDKLDNVELNGIDDTIVLLEDIKRGISVFDKFKCYWLSRKGANKVIVHFEADHIKPDDPAVILFTSGTENFPKGVPLSHRNLLSNQRAAFEAVSLKDGDILLGVLPSFHSFGFSVTGLFPLISGFPVAYSPNPTDGRRMARAIERWKITVLCIAPTFLKNLLRVAKKEQLESLRLIVTGAEKTSLDLYNKVASLSSNIQILEGYGITECAPILTLNPPNKPTKGAGKGVVGPPLSGVTLKVIHPQTHTSLPVGETGLIMAAGENIFHGYLDSKLTSPFVEIDGKKWYNTGDLGYLDEDGYLTLSGRLKRFVKIGGEMISLSAIEEVLSQVQKEQKWNGVEENGPSLAVCAIEEEGKKGEIILFTTFPASIEVVNRELRDKGMSNLIRISQIRELNTIPLLGSGKIDYRALYAKL